MGDCAGRKVSSAQGASGQRTSRIDSSSTGIHRALAPVPPRSRRRERPIDREFLDGHTSNRRSGEFEVAPREGTSSIAVIAHVDLSKLTLERSKRPPDSAAYVYRGIVWTRMALFLTGKQGQLDLALKDANLQRIRGQGNDHVIGVGRRPGKYVMRGVIQESSTGRITAGNLVIEVP